MAIENQRREQEESSAKEIVDTVGEKLAAGKLPFSIFNNSELFEQELETIFADSWMYLGHESEISDPGDYVKRYVGMDPFILVRNEEDDVNVFYDSCRHRGTEVCRSERGNTSHFRCPYHGWTYKTDGDLVGVPKQKEAYADLEKSDWGLLSPPKIDDYEGFIFVSLSEDAPSLDAYLGESKWYLDLYMNFTEGGMEIVGEPMRVEAGHDWKLGAENQSGDWYHAYTTHKSLFESEIDSEDEGTEYGQEAVRWMPLGNYCGVMALIEKEAGITQYSKAVQESLNPDLSSDQLYCLQHMKSFVSNIFPNLSLFHVANNVDSTSKVVRYVILRLWRPIGPDKTEFWNWVAVPREASEEYKRKAYQSAAAWDGTSGIVEQDDLTIAESITKASAGVFAKKNDVELNYQMGSEESGKAATDDEWGGPGKVYKEFNEEYARTFYGNWYEMMKHGGGQ